MRSSVKFFAFCKSSFFNPVSSACSSLMRSSPPFKSAIASFAPFARAASSTRSSSGDIALPYFFRKALISAFRDCKASNFPGSASKAVKYDESSRAASSIRKKPSAIDPAISSNLESFPLARSRNLRAAPRTVKAPADSSESASVAPALAARRSSTLDKRAI
ncbi:unannotated protein [freshwater metagenome]|uniref:Unannotated protein n=1 Tax=freshwater metagenome TaxID=449393 RepID=A0A6J7NW15_9ZZZZ